MMAHEFKLLSRVLKEHSGMHLGEDKMGLVEARLRPLLAEFGFPSFSHLTLALLKPDSHRLRSRVAQAIAVLESYFFRDKTPFAYFSGVMLPRLMQRRSASHRLRIWCAGAATGQEPYSLAMLLAENEDKLTGWRVDLVATDFSEDALVRASKGLYSQFEVQRGLPVSRLVKHFQKSGNGWQVNRDIREKVAFCELNLLDDCRKLGTFDIIFCRNVLIYFDEQVRGVVLGRLAQQLASDGYLVLGAAETTSRVSPDFMPVPESHHGVFCFTPAAVAARAEQGAKGRGETHPDEHPPSGGDGVVPLSVPEAPKVNDGKAAVPARGAGIRAVEIDGKTAELLEARAKARGVSVAELLAEFAAPGSFLKAAG